MIRNKCKVNVQSLFSFPFILCDTACLFMFLPFWCAIYETFPKQVSYEVVLAREGGIMKF